MLPAPTVVYEAILPRQLLCFLLLTATPHNGKEADFQLSMPLLDGDCFEGCFRDGVHTAWVSDLMHRIVKESLLTYDGMLLSPERAAEVLTYNGRVQSWPEIARLVREGTLPETPQVTMFGDVSG